VERDGQRTELTDGKGCTLLGQPVAVLNQPDGRLALGTSAASARPTPENSQEALLVQFQRFWGGPGRGKAKGHYKKGGKHKHKGGDD
jgi:hypothetical protein